MVGMYLLLHVWQRCSNCMIGLPTGLPQSRDVPTASCMAEMFLLRSRMVWVLTGLPQSRNVPSGLWYGSDALTSVP